MSLVRTALRLATLKAIKGKTYAEGRVSDSSIVGLDAAITASPAPIALIYTDDDELNLRGLDIWTMESGRVSLVILISVASKITTGEETLYELPHTDQAMEIGLDMIERQIKRALTDPEDPWAEMWRRIAMKATRWRSTRGQSDKEGNRFAARQIVIDLEPIADPIPGAAPSGLWAEFCNLVEADPDADFAALSEYLRENIAGLPMSSYQRAEMELGLSQAGAESIGLSPFLDHEQDHSEEAAPLVEIILDPDGVTISSTDPEGTDP